MTIAKGMFRWLVASLIVFIVGNGLGYIGRTYECRSDRIRIYVAAPGYESPRDELPKKLYAMNVTRCTLPEQWGGDREPLEGYP